MTPIKKKQPDASKAKHLGRNPFKSKSDGKKSFQRKPGANSEREKENEGFSLSKASEWLFVRLPADTLVFAVKTASLMKGALEKKDQILK